MKTFHIYAAILGSSLGLTFRVLVFFILIIFILAIPFFFVLLIVLTRIVRGTRAWRLWQVKLRTSGSSVLTGFRLIRQCPDTVISDSFARHPFTI